MKVLDNLTLFFCSFNNNKLSMLLVSSFFKQLGRQIPVVIMDNGNKEKITEDIKEVFTVIDNTNFKLVPNQNQLSRNHCSAVDYAFKNCINTKYVLLCDSDILFKPTIKNFLENLDDIDAVGEIWGANDRLMPMFCLINLDKMKQDNINYYDPNRCMNNFQSVFNEDGTWIKDIITPDKWHGDTGASFLWDIEAKHWNIKRIKMNDYIEHYGRGSFDEKNKPLTITQWLELHKELWI